MEAPEETPVCPRHPDRVSYVRCQRCHRPACADCQRPAAVGFQCVDCVAEAQRDARPEVTAMGGRASGPVPYLTYGIIAICVVVQLAVMGAPRLWGDLALAPIVAGEQPYRIITSAFTHAGLMHLGFNMFALYMVGPYLEMLLGRLRYAALYLSCAIGGTIAYLMVQPTDSLTPVVGASGAVFGLFGAVIILNRHLGRDSSGMLATVAINAVIGFVIPNIAWQAHFGGLAVGALLALAFAQSRQQRRPLIAWGAIAVILGVCVGLWWLRYGSAALGIG